MAEKKHRSLFFGITARALMLIAAGLLVVSYVSFLFNPAKAWFMTIFGLLFIPLWLLNVMLLLWAVVRRSKAGFIPFFVLLPTLLIIGRYYQFDNSEPIEGEADVKIVSYNVGRFRASSKSLGLKNSKECRDSVAAFLKTTDADIICLQEFYMENTDDLVRFFRTKFRGYDLKYYVYPTSRGYFGNVTLSRFPAVDKGRIDFEESANLALWSDYDIGGTRVRIYNCHLESYNISLPRIAQAVSRDNYKKVFRDTERQVKSSITRRPKQVSRVLENIENCPVESVVVGDFNDTPLSYTYNRLLKGRRDTFVEAGTGTGATYMLFRPLLRIDYILYPDKYKALNHRVLNKKYSDHYPIEAEIDL